MTLVADLRTRDDASLAALLRSRPDLTSPLPSNLVDLGNRAATRGSVLRALDALDRAALQTLDGLLVLGSPAPLTEVAAVLGSPPEAALRAALDRLRTGALAWGTDDALVCIPTMREVAGRYPAGLGPPLADLLPHQPVDRLRHIIETLGAVPAADVSRSATALVGVLGDADLLAQVVDGLEPAARELLGQTTWAPPVIPLPPDGPATATGPVEALLARGLLVDVGAGTGVVPREVGLLLRGGAIHRESAFAAVELDLAEQPVQLVDRIGAGAAATAVDHVDRMLASWAAEPPQALRAGGLAVRSVTQIAGLLGVDRQHAVLVAEVAFAAGLIGTSDAVQPAWLPSIEYDRWRDRPLAQRWLALARAWLTTTRVPGLAGARDERDQRIAPLGAEADRAAAPALRMDLLRLLDELPPGVAPSAASLHRAIDWRAPRRGGALHDELISWSVAELAPLGLTGLGGLTSYARALLRDDGDGDSAAGVLAGLLPEPVDHVLVQADLTAVAPGPLVARLAHELAAVADVESTGGATVYRFTDRSIQRAFDAGQSADDVHHFLASVSRTPVPQPLTYLVDEVARRHGRVRVSTVATIVRVDDDGTADVLMSDPHLAVLRLRRLAPNVMASRRTAQSVLDALRESGHPAVAEGLEGELLVRQPQDLRAPAYRSARRAVLPAPPPDATLDALVRALRAGERVRESRPADGDPAHRRVRSRRPAETLGLLSETAAAGQTIWIGYVDNNGSTTERLVDPLRVQGGWLTAYDHVRDAVRTFAVHRITGVAPLEPDELARASGVESP